MIAHVTYVYPNPPHSLREIRICAEFACRHHEVEIHTNLDLDLGGVARFRRVPREWQEVRHPFEHRIETIRRVAARGAGAPFLLVDSDAFLLEPLPDELLTSPLFAAFQHPEGGYDLAILGGRPDELLRFADAVEREIGRLDHDVRPSMIPRIAAGSFPFRTLHSPGQPPRGFIHLAAAKASPPRVRERVQIRPRHQTIANSKLSGSGRDQPCFVMLGRYGDIINLLPILRDVARTKEKPAVYVSGQFSDILEAAGYVDAIPVPNHPDDIQPVIREARRRFAEVTVTQVHAMGWTPGRLTPAYNKESWRLAGYLDRWSDPSLRLEFDRRNYPRERELIDRVIPAGETRPIVLYNVRSAYSSPFKDHERFSRWLAAEFGEECCLVDIGSIRAGRIYDLVGLMELADCIVTIDTATLHLAGATSTPVVALLSANGPWLQSAPRRPWATAFPCNEWEENRKAVRRVIRGVIETPVRIVHAFETHEPVSDRVLAARATWELLGWTQAPLASPYPRDARSLGDPRDLAFLRDVVGCALETATDRDLVVLTNDDIQIAPEIEPEIRERLARTVMVTGRRLDIERGAPTGKMHFGRDLVGWRAGWLRHNIESVPDFILGASEWDSWAGGEARRLSGQQPTRNPWIMQHGTPAYRAAVRMDDPIAEIPTGHLRHEIHRAFWASNTKTASERHNAALFNAWKSNR